jgi:hypothetical protein
VSKIDSLENNDKDLEYEKSKPDKDESKDLSSSVCNDESIGDVSGAFFGSSHVGVDSNSHADVTS